MEPQLLERPAPALIRPSYCVSLARGKDEVRETQRLRYQVFSGELDARLQGSIPGHDSDSHDPYCQHLMARETLSNEVVGSFRVLSPAAAIRIGGYHAETTFDLDHLQQVRPRMAELSRCCVHPAYRRTGVSDMLWSGVIDYMLARDHEVLLGCASIGIADGGRHAATVFQQIRPQQMAPIGYRAFPRYRLPYESLANRRWTAMPPLIEEFLCAGGWVCGEPGWNPDFNTADLILMLPLSRFTGRHQPYSSEATA